jgi:peptidoglycan-associated lipoprotein
VKTPQRSQRSISTLLWPLGLLGAAALLGACSSTPVAETKTSDKTVAATPKADGGSTAARTTGQTGGTSQSTVATRTLPAYLDPKSEISMARSLYFDYDASLLRPEFTTLIERHGKYLVANPALPIKIEGNTDERGSAEYNLALGQKRAEAVRRALEVYGVKPSQITVTSWGREKPRASGHDESAWAQNRRADLQYPAQ